MPGKCCRGEQGVEQGVQQGGEQSGGQGGEQDGEQGGEQGGEQRASRVMGRVASKVVSRVASRVASRMASRVASRMAIVCGGSKWLEASLQIKASAILYINHRISYSSLYVQKQNSDQFETCFVCSFREYGYYR